MDFGNEGIVWRVIVALAFIICVSLLWSAKVMDSQTASGLLGLIAGAFFGQYIPTPKDK